MPYTITKTEGAPQPALVVQRRVMQSGIAAAIAEVLPKVFQFAQARGIAIAGPPFCRYIGSGPGMMTIEPGVPIAAPLETAADSEVQAATLPGGPLAFTLHTGPYDRLRDAHAALQEWMASQNLTSAGGPWESYINDPAAVSDPQDWKTEVYWPIK